MRQEIEADLGKISKTSKVLMPLLAITLLSFAVVLIFVPYQVLTSPTATGESFFGSGPVSVRPGEIAAGLLTGGDKLVLLIGVGAISALAIPGLVFAIALVRALQRRELFTATAVRYSRRIAWIFLVYTVLSTVSTIVKSWTPGGFSFSLNPYSFSKDFLILGLIWLFAWIHEIGALLHEDAEMTI